MRIKLTFSFLLFSIVALCGFGTAQIAPPKSLAPPMVPMTIAPPEGHHAYFLVHAKGVQIYSCSDAKGSPVWTLAGPDAQLFDDDGKLIGMHYAVKGPGSSPAWKLTDGSEIVGEKVAAADAPDGKGVPWLLLKVVSNSKHGVLADAAYVQRVNTIGGKPTQEGCTASSLGTQTRSPYTAEYYFAR